MPGSHGDLDSFFESVICRSARLELFTDETEYVALPIVRPVKIGKLTLPPRKSVEYKPKRIAGESTDVCGKHHFKINGHLHAFLLLQVCSRHRESQKVPAYPRASRQRCL